MPHPSSGCYRAGSRRSILPNWALLAAEQAELLWGKDCGLDGSLQQDGPVYQATLE